MAIMTMGGQTLLDTVSSLQESHDGYDPPTSPWMNTVSTSQWTIDGHHDDG